MGRRKEGELELTRVCLFFVVVCRTGDPLLLNWRTRLLSGSLGRLLELRRGAGIE